MSLHVKFIKKDGVEVAKLTLIEKDGYQKVEKIILTDDINKTLVKLQERWVEVQCSEGEINILATSRLANITITKEVPLHEGVTNDQ